MDKQQLSPILLAALAVAATHIEAPITAKPVPMKSSQELRQLSPQTKKVRRNRRRNKLAAQSRKRNRKG